MLNYYNQTFTVYDGNVILVETQRHFIADSTEPKVAKVKKQEITWENIEHLSQIYSAVFPLEFWDGISGPTVGLYSPYTRITKKKRPVLNFFFELQEAEPMAPSLKTLFEYPNSDLVIQYLLERGINYLGKGSVK